MQLNIYSTVQYSTVLYCTVLYCTVLYCTMLVPYYCHWQYFIRICSSLMSLEADSIMRMRVMPQDWPDWRSLWPKSNLSPPAQRSLCLSLLTNLMLTVLELRRRRHTNCTTTIYQSPSKLRRSRSDTISTRWSPSSGATTGRSRWSQPTCWPNSRGGRSPGITTCWRERILCWPLSM